jgi:phosphoribosylformimino-5-aminoimidazole carboxamide ribotide isomerase
VKIIGVLDLRGGLAVHARAGARDRYEAVVKTTGSPIPPGNVMALARSYLFELGIEEIYAADLDAITGGRMQDALIAELASLGAPLWLDAGTTTVSQAEHVVALGASRVVVGLETLAAYDALDDVVAAIGGRRVAFSLDMRDGRPLVRAGSAIAGDTVEVIATRAVRSGVETLIALDLSRVGLGTGPDVDLMARLRRAVPAAQLMAGGGVRSAEDLTRLSSAGGDGALVATALLSGELRLPGSRDRTSG